jgi:hypothetical protein
MGMRHSKTRRFEAGQIGNVDGIPYRIVAGQKSADDLVLELYAGGSWRRIRMDLGFFLAAFFFENEEVIRPPRGRDTGGDYYMRACWDAIYNTWESAAATLRGERANRVMNLKFARLTPEEANYKHKYPRLKPGPRG